jgi:DNA mismatch repair protein MutL
VTSIKVLNSETINKIAAGEVIERPSAALKELLENSADSFPSKIEVDFDQGGKTFLKVSDNGIGIKASELALAVSRHTTSKITSFNDLEKINTFGFRGEALASLAAVSKFSLISTEKDSNIGRKITVSGGICSEVEPAPALDGTTVIVQDLFYNVPARQKFLKSDGGETAQIKRVIRQFALAHPHINIVVRQSQKLLFHFPAQDFLSRACLVMGLLTDDVVFLETEDQNSAMRLQIVLALPEKSLATQQGIWLFVQKRPVVDKTLNYALIEGYRQLLMGHQYPQCVLNLSLDPGEVDINVHPAKSQVKFLDSSAVFRFVSHHVKNTLAKKYNVQTVEAPSATLDFQKPLENQPTFLNDQTIQYHVRQNENDLLPTNSPPLDLAPPHTSLPHLAPPLNAVHSNSWGGLHIIGQLANTYLVCQSGQGLIMIDQHASHERILFEKIKAQFLAASVEKQLSLLDEFVELEGDVLENIFKETNRKLLSQMGFEIHQRGPTTLAITARPAILNDTSLQLLFEKLGEEFEESRDISSLKDLTGEIFSLMACHGAIRAGRVLSLSEMKSLLIQMDLAPFSSFCPHGRPVSVKMSLHEIEKLFKIIV